MVFHELWVAIQDYRRRRLQKKVEEEAAGREKEKEFLNAYFGRDSGSAVEWVARREHPRQG